MKPDDWIMGTTEFFQDECRVDVRMYNNEVERLRLIYDELQSPIADSPFDGKKVW
jgi:hypothetical protein